MEAKNGRFMDVKFVAARDCFLRVSPENVVSMQGKIFKIFEANGQTLHGVISCSATPVQSLKGNEIGISTKFAAVIGLANVKSVYLCETFAAVLPTSQVIFTALESDYSILAMNSAKVENILLDQVRVIRKGDKILVWISSKLYVTLTAEKLTPDVEVGCLSNETELHILPASEISLSPETSPKKISSNYEEKEQIFRMVFSKTPFPSPLVAKIHPAHRPNFLFASAKVLSLEKTVDLQLIEDPEITPSVDFLSNMPVIHLDSRVFLPSGGVFEGCKVLLTPKEVIRNNEFIVHSSEKVSIQFVKEELKKLAESLNKELLILNNMVLFLKENSYFRFELNTAYTNLSLTSITSCNLGVVQDNTILQPPVEKLIDASLYQKEIFSSWRPLVDNLKLIIVTNMKTKAPLPAVILQGAPGCGVEKFLQYIIQEMTTNLKMHDLSLDCKAFKGKTTETLKHKLGDIFLEGAKHSPCIIVFENIDQFFTLQNAEPNETPDSSYRLGVLQIIWSLSRKFSMLHNCFVIATVSSSQDLKIWDDKLLPFEIFHIPELSISDKVEALKFNLLRLNSCWTQELESNCSQIIEICTYQDICDIAGRAVFEKLKSNPGPSEDCVVTKEDLTNARNYLTAQSLKEFNLMSVGDRNEQKTSIDQCSKVGGLLSVKETLTEMIFWPFTYAHLFVSNPLKLQKGALLYGMPGTGKTLIAVELAKSSGMNLIHIKGPELLNKFIGASEEAVRNLFDKASAAKPCILFFDEIDSLAPRRGRDTTGVSDRVVNQLLTSLDGVDSPAEAGVWVLAASSRPDLIDRALLRPGRFDTMLCCNLPSQVERAQILNILSASLKFSSEVDLEKLAEITDGYCGADIQSLLQTAQLTALEEFIDVFSEENRDACVDDMSLEITLSHIKEAFAKTRPSLSKEDKTRYEKIYKEYEQSLLPIGRKKRTQLKQRTVLA